MARMLARVALLFGALLPVVASGQYYDWGRSPQGMRWMQAKREHEAMLRALLAELGMTQPVVTHSNPNPFAVVRQGQAGPVCIVMNLYSSAMETDVTVCLDGKKSELGPMTLAPMEVKILPVAR